MVARATASSTDAAPGRRIARVSPQDSAGFCKHILSRICGDFTSIKGSDSTGDLVRPSCFDLLHRGVQGFQKGLREYCTLFRSQFSSLFFELLQ